LVTFYGSTPYPHVGMCYLRIMCPCRTDVGALVLLAGAVLHCACQTATVDSTTASHIEANSPPADEFQRLLSRDLKSYLDRRTKRDLNIDYELLRNAPTQAGISYPKYYVWVNGLEGKRVVLDGAARVVAIEKTRFEVTHFLSRLEISSAPAEVENI